MSNNENNENNESADIEILNNIQKLQTMEKTLFDNLEKNINNVSMTTDQKNELVDRINGISQNRIELYRTLGDISNFYQQNLNNNASTLNQQTIAVNIVEKELNRAKKRLQLLEQQRINKLRLVEINNYYGEKYNEHSQLMKLIIMIFLPILILTVLANKGFVPNFIYYPIVVVIGFIGIFLLWYKFLSIISRNNMNYQSYDWYFDQSSAPTSAVSGDEGTSSSSANDPWTSSTTVCTGQSCCYSGSTWDASQNICVPDDVLFGSTTTTTTTTTENFENLSNDVFVKYSGINSNKKQDVVLNNKVNLFDPYYNKSMF